MSAYGPLCWHLLTDRATITHHVGTDNTAAHLKKEGNLVTPSHGDIGPAMDLNLVKHANGCALVLLFLQGRQLP